jgi:hypothetical protein
MRLSRPVVAEMLAPSLSNSDIIGGGTNCSILSPDELPDREDLILRY